MVNTPSTRSLLLPLDENDLRIKVLVPLLRGLGSAKVEDWHGRTENGKDIYFTYKDVLGDDQHCCVFVKRGNITKSGATDIRNYEAQLREAFNHLFVNPLDTEYRVKAGSVYIACNGVINLAAKEYIEQNLCAAFPGRVRMMDIDKICYLIDIELAQHKLKIQDFCFDLATFETLCNKTSPVNKTTYVPTEGRPL